MKRKIKQEPTDDGGSSVDLATSSPLREAAGNGTGELNSSTGHRKRAKLHTKECSTCCLQKAVNQFPKHVHTSKHASEVCFKCWEEHLKAEVNNKDTASVQCAEYDEVLGEQEVRKLAGSRTYQKYIHQAMQKHTKANEEYFACPSAGCSWGAFFAKDDGNIFTCQLCEIRWCMTCDVELHAELTCDQYSAQARAKRTEENKLSLKTVGEVSKPCPKCKVNIQKTFGCDHMTCKQCKHEFCWMCFASYAGKEGIRKRGNSAHAEGCKYHSRNLPTAFNALLGFCDR